LLTTDAARVASHKDVRNIKAAVTSDLVTLSPTPTRMVARPPEFGEQTDEVLAEFGFGVDEIVALKLGKVV
jgi:crotonobetainyl-CoA:carnitine CoA-transferase CaiB-like acyl-CoA transferase